MTETCALCAGPAGDPGMGREQVWADDLWRLTTSVGPGDATLGFSYLEPKRHIPHVTDLDGPEAATFGSVLARCTAALKEATGCQLVYVYVFGGGIPHLHLHLAPHNDGDALCEAIIRGEVAEQPLPSGATAIVSKDFPSLPEEDSRAVADRIAELLAQPSGS